MKVEVLDIDQGETISVSTEGMTAVEASELVISLEQSGRRFTVFPTKDQLAIWRSFVAGT